MEKAKQAAPESAVIVIGAGIVGLCLAHTLQKAGYQVSIIDPEEPGSQCSFGNAGAISAGSVAPLAMPGVMKNAAGMLLDADSPLHVPWHYWLRAAPWLRRFVASATPRRVEQIAHALHELFADALANHQALAREIGCPQRVVQTGQLHLYRDAAAIAKDAGSWRLRERHGVRIEQLDAAGVRELEPMVSDAYRAGIFMPEQGAVTEPFRYAGAIAEAARQRGVQFIRDRVRRLMPSPSRTGAWQVEGEQSSWQAAHVVIAAGIWSAGLLRMLGLRVPLESQRGYHLHLPDSGVSISRPLVLADRKVFMVPMETGLRVSGTVEFGGLSMPPTARRAELLGVAAREGLPGLRLDHASTWMGHRPCLPDSLPVIGPVPNHRGLWCAFGHGHLGVTGSINTAHWIAQAMRGQFDMARLEPFSIARF